MAHELSPDHSGAHAAQDAICKGKSGVSSRVNDLLVMSKATLPIGEAPVRVTSRGSRSGTRENMSTRAVGRA